VRSLDWILFTSLCMHERLHLTGEEMIGSKVGVWVCQAKRPTWIGSYVEVTSPAVKQSKVHKKVMEEVNSRA
jgi:hypothetical protein